MGYGMKHLFTGLQSLPINSSNKRHAPRMGVGVCSVIWSSVSARAEIYVVVTEVPKDPGPPGL